MPNPGFPSVTVNTTLTPLAQSTTGIPGEAVPAFALGYNRGPVNPTFVSSWQQYKILYGDFPVANGSLLHYAVYQYFNNGGNGCFVLRVPNTDATAATVNLDGIGSDVSTPILTVTASSPGAWGNQVYVQVVSTGAAGRVNLFVYSGGNSSANLVETFVDMSMNPADPRYLVNLVNSPVSGSANVIVTATLPGNAYVAGSTDLAPISATPLASGSDGSVAPSLGSVVPTKLGQLTGQILNLNLPGWTTIADLNAVVSWANSLGSVFVVIDPPFGGLPLETSAQVAQNAINMVQGGWHCER